MKILIFIGFLVLLILAARGALWAYIMFIVATLLSFPASVGFHLHPQPCEGVPSVALAIYSFGNWGHIVFFLLFFIMTSAQFNMSRWSAFAWAIAACFAMGILVEIAQGISGAHHCRTRDLIPDLTGTLIGAVIVLLWRRFRSKPVPA